MLKKLLLFSTFPLLHFTTYSQTFTSNPNGQIVDNTTSNFSLSVNGLNPNVLDTTNFGIETVCINLTHTWDADLEIYLLSPDGTIVSLATGIGGDQNNYTNTCFNADAADPVVAQNPPFTGTFRPMGSLGLINNGQNPNGSWTLRIRDVAAGDDGTLLSWSVTFGNNPAGYFTMNQSNLPIFIIETGGQSIPDEPKITSDLKVIWNSDNSRNFTSQTDFHYNGKIGIETRGASSSGMPKKSYAFEFRDVNGFQIDSSLCGFPAESDWVLSAQYTDKTLLRNMFSMHLIEEMGWYAPRSRPVELILDGEYKGVYILLEKVKRGNDRVDIAKLQPTEINGDDLTGGYILKLDRDSGSSSPGFESEYAPWPAGDPIVIDYYYPKGDVIVPQQEDYIQTYINQFETALIGPDFASPTLGFRQYANVESCIDALIISEFSRNIDAYRKSFYLYKDKESNGGKLVMAPIWDYDLTFGNVNFCEGEQTDGWQYNFNYVCGGDSWINPFWWERLTQDATFNQEVRCRWKQLRVTSLSEANLDAWIDSMAAALEESQEWNFDVWQTMGVYVWPNNFVGQTYASEVNYMKTWMHDRLAWLDANFPGDESQCFYAGVDETAAVDAQLYPNPFSGSATVSLMLYYSSPVSLRVFDAAGKVVVNRTIDGKPGTNLIDWNAGELSSGVYTIELKLGSHVWRTKGVKE